jgi:hypothetical protein
VDADIHPGQYVESGDEYMAYLKLHWCSRNNHTREQTKLDGHLHLSSNGGESTLCGVESKQYNNMTHRAITPDNQLRCQECIEIWDRMVIAVEKARADRSKERRHYA